MKNKNSWNFEGLWESITLSHTLIFRKLDNDSEAYELTIIDASGKECERGRIEIFIGNAESAEIDGSNYFKEKRLELLRDQRFTYNTYSYSRITTIVPL